MNIYSLQFLMIFFCYLNTLVFTSVLCFSCFICLDDRIILICDCMIYSFIRSFSGMPISIMQWRVKIGIFNIRFYIRCKSNPLGSLARLVNTIAEISITLLSIFPLLCGDLKSNPGPT